ncbi:unnamed protein product [Arctia plantaginis]|uniref:Uncharacterized protein n=1 Tax=Arctia plantaginis TaxID=874455 RepID=A0A8S1APX0_ARCPL|nr:unnamed protein product [Arctia plantaginis]
MALYGAPVWVAALTAPNRARLWRPQRVLAVRAIRGYRTVFTEAACALTGTPPWDLEAEVLAEVYRRVADFRAESGFRPPPENVCEWREAARRATMVRWSFRLETPRAADHRRVGRAAARDPYLPADAGAFRARLLRKVPVLGR